MLEELEELLAKEAKEEEEYNPEEEREKYIERMQNEGFVIVYPNDRELQIDLDTEDDYGLFLDQLQILIKETDYIYGEPVIKPSRNGLPGRHVTIQWKYYLSDVERIAWQSALGSDPMRELLSMVRRQRGDSHPTLFVEKPE